jgi:hypothetical protein
LAGLKAAVRDLWPAENRPYYLQRLLRSYDGQMQYWYAERRLFAELRAENRSLFRRKRWI